jgi:hypothetical protein
LYNQEIEKNIILMNFQSLPNEVFGKDGYDYTLKCKVCSQRFIYKKEETMFSTLIDHAKSHYIDKDIIKKEWIAKEIIHLNYDSVLQVNATNLHTANNVHNSITYRELTKREADAYSDVLHRIGAEESVTRSKGR